MEECPVFAGHFYYFSTNAKKYSLKMLPYAKKSGIIEVLMCNAPSEMESRIPAAEIRFMSFVLEWILNYAVPLAAESLWFPATKLNGESNR